MTGAVISCVGVRAAMTRLAKGCWAAFGRGGGHRKPHPQPLQLSRQAAVTGFTEVGSKIDCHWQPYNCIKMASLNTEQITQSR